jgi:hypothetical protein
MGRKGNIFDQIRGNEEYDPEDQGTFIPGQVFVAMAFNLPDSHQTFQSIMDACKDLQLNASRVDDSVGSSIILLEIIKKIEEAEFCIFDLTGERPNVYYELGFAHGVGNNAEDILVIARDGASIHFDVSPFRICRYASHDACRALVRQQLAAMIAKTRRA